MLVCQQARHVKIHDWPDALTATTNAVQDHARRHDVPTISVTTTIPTVTRDAMPIAEITAASDATDQLLLLAGECRSLLPVATDRLLPIIVEALQVVTARPSLSSLPLLV
jgi:hypothetical protein